MYATESDLRDRLGSEFVTLLADEDGDGTGDTAILTAVLDDAAAEIDMSLAGRYTVPVTPVPQQLLRLAVDLAVYFLFLRLRKAISPEYLTRWKQAREALDRFGRGAMDLEGAQPRLKNLKTESSTREVERRFDRESLDSF